MTPFQMVKEFHEKFGMPVGNKPKLLKKNREKLRMNLITEEYKELKRAVKRGDLVKIMDGLADIQYVVNGMAVELGVDLDDVFAEVHRSNMSKLGADGKPIYRKDGKVLKGPSFSEPDIRGRLLLQGWG